MRWFALAALSAALLVGTGLTVQAAPVSLTLWENYGTEVNATATRDLAKAFEALHPGVTINVVGQPADNYFALLTAATMARKAPDLAVMWTGLFALKYQHLLADLSPLLPAATLKEMIGLAWSAADFDPAKGVYVVPLEDQFYIGFYNKALFQKAGLSGPPRNWAELESDCSKLKAAGITPMLYGSGSQNLNAEFYPYYDLSYLMAGIYKLPQWKQLYDGSIPWTAPAIEAQVQRWVDLRAKGCTNSDVLTTNNTVARFANGEAAMIVKGNWNLQQLYDKLGKDLGAFVPPYATSDMSAVIQFPGDGFSIMRTSNHKKEAASFLEFLMSAQGQKIVADAGLVPDREGFAATNPLYHGLLGLTGQGYTAYPMIDNVIQPSVVDVGSKVLTAAFAGQMSVDSALGKMKAALMVLPADQRGASYR
ncbi:MAG: ABC transporter substrate-binding protein [Acetobacteraceae bacterium]